MTSFEDEDIQTRSESEEGGEGGGTSMPSDADDQDSTDQDSDDADSSDADTDSTDSG
jgi:hypothetical protein